MPDIQELKGIIELGLLTVAAFAFVISALWDKYVLRPLFTNLTEAVKALTLIVTPLKDFSAHDERSKGIDVCQEQMNTMLENIGREMVTKDELIRVHDRIDHLSNNVATKNDMQQVSTALNLVSSTVSELKGRSDKK